MIDKEAKKMAQIEWFKNSLQHHETLTNAVTWFDQSLLRGSLLLNGGAIIALLSVYSVLGDKPAVQGPLALWVLGLLACAAAAWFAFQAQWKFQISSSRNYQVLAKHFFALEGPEPLPPADSKDVGKRWRDLFWGFWIASVAAFVLGSLVAAFQLP